MSVHQPQRRVILAGLAGAGLALAGGLPAALAQSAQVTVADAWARPTPPHATTGVIYLTLTSAADDRLVGASTPVAREASIHRTTQSGGVMQMRPVTGGLVLSAGKPVALSPGGYHIMLMGLKAPLHAGQSIPLHLTFATATPVDVTVTVRPLGGGSESKPDAMPGMKMD